MKQWHVIRDRSLAKKCKKAGLKVIAFDFEEAFEVFAAQDEMNKITKEEWEQIQEEDAAIEASYDYFNRFIAGDR